MFHFYFYATVYCIEVQVFPSIHLTQDFYQQLCRNGCVIKATRYHKSIKYIFKKNKRACEVSNCLKSIHAFMFSTTYISTFTRYKVNDLIGRITRIMMSLYGVWRAPWSLYFKNIMLKDSNQIHRNHTNQLILSCFIPIYMYSLLSLTWSSLEGTNCGIKIESNL